MNNTCETQYKITVKKYMTQKSFSGFNFMKKFNNDNPMPLRTMIGTIQKETKGMVYMKLHGQAAYTERCMKCGRILKDPVSQFLGIGPECISQLGLSYNITDIEMIKEKLVDIIWEGWIIRSSIVSIEVIQ